MGVATRLSLYNDALLHCDQRSLASLEEASEPRYLLDQVWTSGKGAVNKCLEQGFWFFAMRTALLDADPSIGPSFGYRYAFPHPADWVRTSAVCSDEYYAEPLTRYADEAGHWFADVDQIFVKYVSDDSAYGNNFALWPETFNLYVSLYLASRIIGKLSQGEDKKEGLRREMQRVLLDAKNKDIMNQAAMFPPAGTWARARLSGSSRRRECWGAW